MSGKIRLLTDEVIGKIAAGEVVERPAAAIKEMVENCLDAGATAITVEIRDGGITYFRVTDNGSGIEQSEIRMAFERHATSKISSSQDLAAIQTLGFRGEALASIAAVSKVTCTTRTKRDSTGVKVENHGGRIVSVSEAACPEGTTFVVRDLFYNTPVRLKFLKKPATEAGYVSDLMMRLILSRPDVSIRYISQGKTLYHSAGDGKLSSAVFSIYGKEIRNMREINGHQAGVVIQGYVGVGDNGRATRAHQSFFINGRYMKSSVISSAVEAACRELVVPGRYPACVLHLTMPYELVDVNVHPNKLECRFQNDAALAQGIEETIRDAMKALNPLEEAPAMQINPINEQMQKVAAVRVAKQMVPEKPVNGVAAGNMKPLGPTGSVPSAAPTTSSASVVKAVQPPVPEVKGAAEDRHVSEVKTTTADRGDLPKAAVPAEKERTQPLQQLKPMAPLVRPKPAMLNETPTAVLAYMQSAQPVTAAQAAVVPNTADAKAQTAQSMTFLPEVKKTLRIIGHVFNSYIMVEYDQNLLLIDQQGVHERLLFDRMMKAYDTKTCSQELLVPMVMAATRREQQLLETHRELLQGIGLTVEPIGETEVAIRAIPMILGQPQAGDLLKEIIGQLENERGVISFEKRRAGILALACKKAVRSGDALKEEDMRELVVRMVEQKITPASPRGTPLIIVLTKSDIDRRFRRSH